MIVLLTYQPEIHGHDFNPSEPWWRWCCGAPVVCVTSLAIRHGGGKDCCQRNCLMHLHCDDSFVLLLFFSRKWRNSDDNFNTESHYSLKTSGSSSSFKILSREKTTSFVFLHFSAHEVNTKHLYNAFTQIAQFSNFKVLKIVIFVMEKQARAPTWSLGCFFIKLKNVLHDILRATPRIKLLVNIRFPWFSNLTF